MTAIDVPTRGSFELSHCDFNRDNFRWDAAASVYTCGYEGRCSYLPKLHFESARDAKITVLGFASFMDIHSRNANEEFFRSHNCEIQIIPDDDIESLWNAMLSTLAVARDLHQKGSPLLDIDISSMPRSWYCNIIVRLLDVLRAGETCRIFYCRGRYLGTHYPTVGCGTFKHFAGKPTVNPHRTTYLIGLSLDYLRTYAMWSLLDPESAIAVLSRTSDNEGILNNVISTNCDLLSQCDDEIYLDTGRFDMCISALMSYCRELRLYGDVVLVPDGPKTLILAMSLVPHFMRMGGYQTLHVDHARPHSYTPVDVDATGDVHLFDLRKK